MSDEEKKFSAEFLGSPFLEPIEKRIGEKVNAGENAKEIARELNFRVNAMRNRIAMLMRLNIAFTTGKTQENKSDADFSPDVNSKTQ